MTDRSQHSMFCMVTLLFLFSLPISCFLHQHGRVSRRNLHQTETDARQIRLQFLSAVYLGNLYVVEQLNIRYPDLNLLDSKSPGGTPAIWSATYHNATQIVRYLVENGADVNAANSNGTTAAYISAQKGYLHCLNLLIDAGARLNIRSKWNSTVLSVGVQEGYWKIVERLLQENMTGSMNAATNEQQQTPLWVAAHNGYIKIIGLLIKHRADLESRDITGATPLWAAAQEGHGAAVTELLSSGANPNMTNINGRTPLHAAVAFCHSGTTVRIAQAFPHAVVMRDKDGNLPIDLLCLNEELSTSEILRMEYHVIPSVAAVQLNKTDLMIKWVVNKNRPLPRLSNGQNLLHVATSFGNKEATEFLLDYYPQLTEEYDNEGKLPQLTIGSLRSLSDEERQQIKDLFIKRGYMTAPEEPDIDDSDTELSKGSIALIVILVVFSSFLLVAIWVWIYCLKCLGKNVFCPKRGVVQSKSSTKANGDPKKEQTCSFFDSASTNTDKGGRRIGGNLEEQARHVQDCAEDQTWRPFNYIHYLNTENEDITADVLNVAAYESLQMGQKKEDSSITPTYQYADEGASRLHRPVELAEIEPVPKKHEIEVHSSQNEKHENSATNTTDSHPDMLASWSTGPTKDASIRSHSITEKHQNQETLRASGSDTFTPRMTYMNFEEIENLEIIEHTKNQQKRVSNLF